MVHKSIMVLDNILKLIVPTVVKTYSTSVTENMAKNDSINNNLLYINGF